MSVAAKAEPKNAAKGMSDAEVVEAYLTASMIPDPEAAAAYMKPGTIITFTGCPGAEETVVYSIGTLYGEWLDGTVFEGNRYVDRFVVKGGQIVKMDVWNDSAERILLQMGIEA